jgi:adenylylsulfate reductase subunit B
MSIWIDETKCSSCGQCIDICPGGLLEVGPEKKAAIRYKNDCWGCGSCLKECPVGAINLYLPPALGGRGALLKIDSTLKSLDWTVEFPDGQKKKLVVLKQKANCY